MRQRTISGFVICAFVLGFLCFSYIPAVTMTATSVLCGLCTYELARATGAIHSKGLFFLALSFSLGDLLSQRQTDGEQQNLKDAG